MGSMLLCVCFVTSFCIFAVSPQPTFLDESELPRIAIIGGGIGGTTAAYKLQQLFGGRLTNLDVYEPGKIGGRMRTITINDYFYEVGGSIVHSSNQHMVNYAKMLGLPQNSGGGDNFAFWEKKEITFESAVNSMVSSLQLLWRYGMSLFRMESHTSSFLTDFGRIYGWQKDHQSFTTVPNLMLSMSDDIMNATTLSFRDQCIKWGLSEQLIEEIALTAGRNNYGQTLDNLSGLVGAVSLAGAGGGGYLWSVKGGNHLVPEGLLKDSQANLKKSTVIKVSNITKDNKHPLFSVQTQEGETTDYDVVVLAHPLIKGQPFIEFSGFNSDFTEHSREYHRTLAYVVEGEPNYTHFGFESHNAMPGDIFPLDKDSFFNSLGEIFPVNRPKKMNQRVYKVFANSPLSQVQLDLLFKTRKTTELVDWLAYPEYMPNAELVPFVFAPNLYYVNAIESAASAMEMSAIGGNNVANLVAHFYMGNDHLIDNMFIIEEKHIKIEL